MLFKCVYVMCYEEYVIHKWWVKDFLWSTLMAPKIILGNFFDLSDAIQNKHSKTKFCFIKR